MKNRGSEWISIADMMAGVMMIFMLITVSYMYMTFASQKELEEKNKELQELNQKMQSVALTYEKLQHELYQDLVREFSPDLESWNALIDPEDNTIRFREPDVLFDSGKSRVKPEFRDILSDFFPRYIRILSQPKYQDNIEEIRIEGHTSSEWKGAHSLIDRYMANMMLSQNRAWQVMRYSFGMNEVRPEREWLIKVLRANGMAFAKPLADQESSRRVEFRTITKAHKKIMKILDISREKESLY